MAENELFTIDRGAHMSRLTHPLPFEPQGYECRPGHTLRRLCGINEERNGLQPCVDAKTSRIRCHHPPDGRVAKKGKHVEDESA